VQPTRVRRSLCALLWADEMHLRKTLEAIAWLCRTRHRTTAQRYFKKEWAMESFEHCPKTYVGMTGTAMAA
jgi:hypothetical protein